jgi:hypothetical protein
MSAYIPKIVISHFSNVNKGRFENANGEMQMLIEKDLTRIDNSNQDQSDDFFTTSMPTAGNVVR